MKILKVYKNYASVYHKNNLLGQTKTLMAHCVHLNDEEILLQDILKVKIYKITVIFLSKSIDEIQLLCYNVNTYAGKIQNPSAKGGQI